MRVTRHLGNPGRHIDRRPLHLKIRVQLTKAMTADEARALLHRAVTTGRVPPGIRIHWIDWEKGMEGRVARGRVRDDIHSALRDFYGAITQGDTRFERVR